MQTLTKGFKKPQTGDKGSVVFPALEDDIQQMNDHTHNGTNSQRLTPVATQVGTITIAAVNWVDQGGGHYRQTLTLPVGYTYADCMISIKDNDGSVYSLTIEKIGALPANQFYVYCDDNTFAGKAIITS